MSGTPDWRPDGAWLREELAANVAWLWQRPADQWHPTWGPYPLSSGRWDWDSPVLRGYVRITEQPGIDAPMTHQPFAPQAAVTVGKPANRELHRVIAYYVDVRGEKPAQVARRLGIGVRANKVCCPACGGLVTRLNEITGWCSTCSPTIGGATAAPSENAAAECRRCAEVARLDAAGLCYFCQRGMPADAAPVRVAKPHRRSQIATTIYTHLARGRRELSEDGAFPWALAADGRLPAAWRDQPVFAAALHGWMWGPESAHGCRERGADRPTLTCCQGCRR